MKKMMPLFEDIQIEDTDEQKASAFISKLQSQGFVGRNKIYLQNYIDGDVGIALGHIKSNYKRYVLEAGWSEEKFEDVVNVIIRHRRMLIPNVFLRYGMMYDDGKLKREVQLERAKYEKESSKAEDELTKEEKELLEYIEKHGGAL